MNQETLYPLSEVRALAHPSCPEWLDPAERVNILSHLLAAALAAVATSALLFRSLESGEPIRLLAFTAFGSTVVAAYVASVLFHASKGEFRTKFGRYDRLAIYIGIVGHYLPLVWLGLTPVPGLILTLYLVSLASIGVRRELRTFAGGDSILLYLLMGWGPLVLSKPLISTLTWDGMAWWLAGGLAYSVGAIVCGCPRIPRRHEIWHGLGMVGTACYFFVMFRFLG